MYVLLYLFVLCLDNNTSLQQHSFYYILSNTLVRNMPFQKKITQDSKILAKIKLISNLVVQFYILVGVQIKNPTT